MPLPSRVSKVGEGVGGARRASGDGGGGGHAGRLRAVGAAVVGLAKHAAATVLLHRLNLQVLKHVDLAPGAQLQR